MNRNELIEIHAALREEYKKEWDRVLSFGELTSDRWEKAKHLGFGEKTSIYDSSLVYGDVKVGNNSWIGPFTILDGSGGLSIGSFCSISTGVQIYTHDSVKWALSGGQAPCDKAPVNIGNNCYVGPNTIISKGVTIGDLCVIGANTLINKDVPDNSIVFGTPGKIVGKVIKNEKNEITFQYNKNAQE